MKKIIQLLAFVASISVALFSTNAAAVVVIDFQTGAAGAGGTIDTDGTNVWGSDINISLLILDGTAMHDGSYTAAAKLAFDTGNMGNFITITGTIDPFVATSQDLLTGSFTGWDYSEMLGNEIFEGWGVDTKSCALLCEIGVKGNAWEFFGFSIESRNGTVISTDIVNTQVPVPAAVWLFGSGLLGLVGVARRRMA